MTVLVQWVHRHKLAIQAICVVILAILSFTSLRLLLSEVHMHDVRQALRAIDAWQIGLACLFTVASYFALTLYDVMALRAIGKPLPYRTAALASFTSYTFSHNFGFALLTGGSARYTIYSAAGLGSADIVRVIAFASAAFWGGVFTLLSIALLLHGGPVAIGGLSIGPWLAKAFALAVLATLVGAVALLSRLRHPVHIFQWRLPHIDGRLAIAQVAISAFDLACASAALFVLIPHAPVALFPYFFIAYSLAIVVALVSHIPGGIGAFEAVVLTALAGIDKSGLFAALILYRFIYYLMPLAVAALMLAIHQHRQLRKPVAMALETAQFAIRGIAPPFIAASVFVGGVILLVSGSMPAVPGRIHVLRDIVPLPFVEASHIAASLAGTGLLLLVPGLLRRLDAAFHLCRLLLVAGAIFSMTKGVDYEEALILILIAATLQFAQPCFYRKTALTTELGSARSIGLIAAVLTLSAWIVFFAYRHVDYQNDLWWQFAWSGDASRSLRAIFAACVLIVATLIYRLQSQGNTARPEKIVLEDVDAALSQSTRTDAMLALTGDKRLLWSDSGDSMLMYQIQGQSWIVMGDPVGKRDEWADLLWALRERADREQGRLLIYQLSMDAVPIAIDMGLQLIKYGEEAVVRLTDFTLDGPDMKALRYAVNRAEREGAEFEIVKKADVLALLPQLRAVSDEWLRTKNQTEKAFSIGRFDSAYLSQFDIAVVRRLGQVVAFANVWATASKEELSIDLMRHADNMPYGSMDYLFARLMMWGKANGFAAFNLGLAPLSGLEARRLAPIWTKAGAFLFRHGEALYGFEGLRAYKDKFCPQWRPRYIAGPHGIGFGRALVDLQTLINGGSRSAARRTKLTLVA